MPTKITACPRRAGGASEPDDLAAEKTVGAARVGLAGLLREASGRSWPMPLPAESDRSSSRRRRCASGDQFDESGWVGGNMAVVPLREEGVRRAAGSIPPIRQAMSSASSKLRIGMLSPRQSCTDPIPASRSRQSVVASGRVFSSEVLPTPLGPRMTAVLFGCLRQPFVGGDDAQRHQAALAVGRGGPCAAPTTAGRRAPACQRTVPAGAGDDVVGVVVRAVAALVRGGPIRARRDRGTRPPPAPRHGACRGLAEPAEAGAVEREVAAVVCRVAPGGGAYPPRRRARGRAECGRSSWWWR